MINIEEAKIRIVNFVRTNPGYGVDQVSRTLSIPLNVVHQAIAELHKEGKLNAGGALRLKRS